jgi:hypothetical protein
MESNYLSIHQKGDLVYISFPAFDKTNLVNHCFTTKLGGVSEGQFSSLNLGYNRGDSSENVDTNYKIICQAIGVTENRMVLSHQVHKDEVYVVGIEDLGKGKVIESNIKEKDALITDVKNAPLVTFYADCVPIFLLDPIQKVIGLAHAGWRGTVQKIGKKTVESMMRTYGSNPKDILAGIAPSIGPCCFEVGEEVVLEFRACFTKEVCDIIIKEKENKKAMIDLWQANVFALLEAGLLREHITVTDLCTMCHSDVFYSHRATDGKRGNLAAIMALKD